MRFGKLPPKTDYRTLLFSSYVKDDLPDPDEKVSQSDRVYLNLDRKPIPELFPMYKNDLIGDCTICGMAHGITVYHGMVDQLHIPLEQNVVKTYYHLSGGIDSGLYLLDVVKYWRSTGLEGAKVFSYVKVNYRNRTHVKQAIQMFGGLLVGFQCQEKVVEEFQAGHPWQPGTPINAGHCVYITGYDAEFVECLTWGSITKGSWAWWDKHIDECYVLLPDESKLEGFTPGFDFEKLKSDLAEVALY